MAPLSPHGHLQVPPPPPISGLEIQTLVIAVGAGLWLGVAQSFSHSAGPIYRVMRSVDEWTWTCALLLGAVLCVLGVLGGWLGVRKLGLVTIGLVWFLMAGCFLAGNPHAFTTWTYTALAFSALYSALRLHR